MAKARVDRRVRRTKARLKETLLELIAERDYDRITVRDLTDRADIGRSTFYSHYDSKEDLLFDGFEAWVLSLADEESGVAAAGAPRFRFSLPMLRHLRSQERFFGSLMADGAGRVRQRVTLLFAKVVRRELEREGRGGERDALAHALAGAFGGLAAWWLRSGRGLSPEALDALFQSLAPADRGGAREC